MNQPNSPGTRAAMNSLSFNSPQHFNAIKGFLLSLVLVMSLAHSPLHAQTTTDPNGNVVTGTGNTLTNSGSATPTPNNDTVTGLNNDVNGGNISVTGQNNTLIAIPGTFFSGSSNVVGSNNSLTGNGSNLVGSGGTLNGTSSNGFGNNLHIQGDSVTCMGDQATCGNAKVNPPNVQGVASADVGIGMQSQATGGQSTATGGLSSATAQFSSAYGYMATCGYQNSLALASGTQCDATNQVALGNRRLSQLAYGTGQYDGVAVGQLYTMASAFGGGANFNNGTFTAPFYSLSGGTFVDVGSALTYLDNRITNLPTGGNGGPGTDPNAVHYDNGSKGSVTLQGGNGTKVTNVAAGDVSANSTDAVNGSQLYATNQQVTQNTQNITTNTSNIKSLQDNALQFDPSTQTYNATRGGNPTIISGVANGIARTDAVNVGQLDDAINGAKDWAKSYTDQRFNQLNDKFNSLAAQSAALANTAASFAGVDSNKKNLFAVGMGLQGGRVANAIMYQHRNENGYSAWNASVSFTQGNGTSVGVGYAIGW